MSNTGPAAPAIPSVTPGQDQEVLVNDRPINPEALKLPEAKLLDKLQEPEQRKLFSRALESLLLTTQQQTLHQEHLAKAYPGVSEHSIFTTYDCGDPRSVHRSYSLVEPDECEPLKGRHGAPVEAEIQVLQTNVPLGVTAWACKITTSRAVTQCGFSSLNYGSVPIETEKQWPMTPQKCRDAVRAQTVEFDDQKLPVFVGGSRTTSYFKHGGVEIRDWHFCQNSHFMYRGRTYKDSYMTVTATVTIEVLRGLYNPSTGRVRFSNGLTSNYYDRTVEDGILGSISWNTHQFSCAERMSSIFNGTATLHPINNASSIGNEGDLVMISESKENRFAGLVLKSGLDSCGSRLFQTQLKDIVVQVLKPGETPVPSHFVPWGEADTASLASNLGFIHLDRSMHQDKRFLEVRSAICENERKFIAAQLAMSAGHSSYALIHSHGVGHVLTRAGSVVHVTSCTPRLATYRLFPNCTQEIPVQIGNETAFADPLTWVLQRYPTVVPCDRITPVMWQINDRWICAYPEPSSCPPPAILSPTSNDGLGKLHDFTHGLGGSIFSPEQRRQHYEALELASSREAMVTEATRRAIRRAEEHSTGALGSFIDDADLQELTRRVAGKIMPLFGIIGEYWALVTGLLVTIAILKVIFGCMARMVLTYRRHGCGLWVVMSIWHTAFSIMNTLTSLTTAAARGAVNTPRLDEDPNQPGATHLPESNDQDVPGESKHGRSESRYRVLQNGLDAIRESQARIVSDLQGVARPPARADPTAPRNGGEGFGLH